MWTQQKSTLREHTLHGCRTRWSTQQSFEEWTQSAEIILAQTCRQTGVSRVDRHWVDGVQVMHELSFMAPTIFWTPRVDSIVPEQWKARLLCRRRTGCRDNQSWLLLKTSTMGIEFIQKTNDIKILFFTYKAKATNVVLESKAKAKDSHQGQGQGQAITRRQGQGLTSLIPPRHYPSQTIPPFLHGIGLFPLFHHHHPPVYNVKRSTVIAYKIDSA